jgi:serine O-acetyltransferase
MPDSTLHATPGATGLASGAENLNPPDIAFWTLVREDLAIHDGDLLSQGFWALFWHRFGNWRMSVKPKLLRAPLSLIYRIMFKACEWFCGISLPYTTIVGRRVCLEHFGGMILVPVSIGSDVTVRQNMTMGIPSNRARAARPVIEDHVDIGAGAVIIGAITVGRGAIIGANAVVTKSVPPCAVVVGVPGRVTRYRHPAGLGDPPAALDDAASMP